MTPTGVRKRLQRDRHKEEEIIKRGALDYFASGWVKRFVKVTVSQDQWQ